VLVCEDTSERRLRPDQALVRVCACIPPGCSSGAWWSRWAWRTWPKSLESLAPRACPVVHGQHGRAAPSAEVVSKQLKPVVDRVYPLAEIRAAHERLENREHFGKVIVTP